MTLFDAHQTYECGTCHNRGMGDPRHWHHYMHEFTLDGGLFEPEPESVPAPIGTDPVLRVALLQMGVITPQDLADAAASLGIVGHQGPVAPFTAVSLVDDAPPGDSTVLGEHRAPEEGS